MKRSVLLLALATGAAPLFSCGVSTEVLGLETLGSVTSVSKNELGSAIVTAASLSNTQQILFGLDIDGPAALDPVDCTDGGSFQATFEVDEPPLGQISSGDRVRVEFQSCTEGDSTFQGALVFSFETVAGDPSSDAVWSLSGSLLAEDFVRATASSQRLANGTLALRVEAASGDYLITLSGSYTTSVSDAQGTHVRRIDDLSLTWNYSGTTLLASLEVDGDFGTDADPGIYRLTTVEPLLGAPFEVPGQGELRVTGDGDATLSLLVEPGQVVRLRLDSDGDGIIDDVESIPWDQL